MRLDWTNVIPVLMSRRGPQWKKVSSSPLKRIAASEWHKSLMRCSNCFGNLKQTTFLRTCGSVVQSPKVLVKRILVARTASADRVAWMNERSIARNSGSSAGLSSQPGQLFGCQSVQRELELGVHKNQNSPTSFQQSRPSSWKTKPNQ